MRRHARASTAGPTQRQASGLGRIFRGALAGRAVSSRRDGSGAPSHRRRLALLALTVTASLAIPAAQASAEIVVDLSGAGSGTVTSTPPGIECSNVGGGSPGPACGASFGETGVQLSAAPGSGSFFSHWSGDDPFPGFFGPTCNEGSADPCATIDLEGFGFPPGSDVHITATFDPLPDPPMVSTGGVGSGADELLLTLQGTVNPNEFAVEDCHFEFDTQPYESGKGPHGTSLPCVPNAAALGEGSSDKDVSAEVELEGLTPNTTYHYRLVASNLGGAGKGEDRTFTTGPAPVGECPNEARRQEQGTAVLHLPDCMALEMVSPPRKAGFPAKAPSVSADGSRVSFRSTGALGENPPGLLDFTANYVASRSGSGWASEMTVPHVDPRFGGKWAELRPSFTPDFSRWLGIGATAEQLQQGIDRAYEAGLGDFFRPLSQPLVPLFFFKNSHSYEVIRDSQFQGASADHSHLYFRPGVQATYLAGDPSPVGPGAESADTYLARSGEGGQPAPSELLQRDRTGKVWGGNCGARLGGIGSVATPDLPAPNGERNQGAVSADGSRTYFSTRPTQSQSGPCEEASKLRILERVETPSGPQIAPLFSSECTRSPLPDPPGPCEDLSGDDLYQGASLDQSRVYLTTNRQLASSDVDGSNEECNARLEEGLAVPGCDLYLYDRTRPAGKRLVQVSAGEELGPAIHEVGREADVYNGITAISADGSHVYFVAAGVLTDHADPAGETAQEGEPNLYTWDAESEDTAFVGTLAPDLGPSDLGDAIVFNDEGNGLWGGQGTWHNDAYPVPVSGKDSEGREVGGDGHVLLFESRAELTANDADGRRLDVYRYNSVEPDLACLSCAPGSSASKPDEATFDVDPRGVHAPLGTDFAESDRWVSEDGQEVGFMTPESLLPGDVNGVKDGYLWRQGSLVRLPGKPFLGPDARGPALSHDGSTVAFATPTPLLPQDSDAVSDVYVARVGGGFPNPAAAPICVPGDPDNECQRPEPPPAAPQAASEAAGAGNPKPRSCRKGKVRRHGRCVARHRHQAKKRHRNRQTDTDRRAAK